jgi:pantetheine-phosphate adenylyltransferase
MTSIEYSFLSSSIVKELASHGGCVAGMVPDHVAKALRDKYRKLKESATIPRYLTS